MDTQAGEAMMPDDAGRAIWEQCIRLWSAKSRNSRTGASLSWRLARLLADLPSASRSVAVHLMLLCLILERSLDSLRHHRSASSQSSVSWMRKMLPITLRALNDVRSVWTAWSLHHR